MIIGVAQREAALRIGERAREVCEFVDLRMIKPGVERQAEAAKDRKSLAEALVGQQPWWRVVGGIAHGGVRVSSTDMADTAEAVAAGTNMGR